jgi:hypothetical protein
MTGSIIDQMHHLRIAGAGTDRLRLKYHPPGPNHRADSGGIAQGQPCAFLPGSPGTKRSVNIDRRMVVERLKISVRPAIARATAW